jgi:hypothetical protein
MTPKNPRGAQPGTEGEARASGHPSAPRDLRQAPPRAGARSRDDDAFMEEVVRDILAQNERARSTVTASFRPGPPSSDGEPSCDVTERSARPPELEAHITERSARAPATDLHTTEPSARAPEPHSITERQARGPAPEVHTTERSARAIAPPAAPVPAASPAAERPRTVRVERDSGFRTPEGVATARAYLPAKTLSPGRTEPIEVETVKVNDPRKLPTMRLPRDRRSEAPADGSSTRPRPAPAEEGAPTLRSLPESSSSVFPQRLSLSFWIAGVVGVAVFGVLLVALAARFWPSVVARPSPSVEPGPSNSRPAPVAPTALVTPGAPPSGPAPGSSHAAAPPTAAPTSDPSGAHSSTAGAAPRSAPRSDRWF